MFDITFEDIFAEKLPNLTLLALSADISDAPTCDALWNEVQTVASRIASSYEMSMVNKRPGIAAHAPHTKRWAKTLTATARAPKLCVAA